MITLLTRHHAWRIMWAVSFAAGMTVLSGAVFSAVTNSGWVALAAFAVSFAAIVAQDWR